jgi:hypothetical protein
VVDPRQKEYRVPHPNYNLPGIYRIRVSGHVDARWADRLGGLRISAQMVGDEACAELIGHLADQAALYGVLNTLYDYRYPLLYVEYVGPAEAGSPGGENASAD